jgi:hypothetical protein
MFTWDVAYFIDAACIVGGTAEVRTVAPVAAILAFCQRFAVFNIVIISATPETEKGVVAGAVSPGIIKVVMCVGNLIVSHLFKGQHTVDNVGGDVVIGIVMDGVCNIKFSKF